MGRPPRRRGLARATAVTLALAALASAGALALAALAPASALAAWDSPFRFAQPVSLDILAPRIAFSASGAAAVSYSVENADNPSQSHSYVAWRSARGRRSEPQRIPSSQEILGSDFNGSTLELLSGTSPSKEGCCSSVAVRSLSSRGTLGHPQRLVSKLTGATSGRLLSLSNGMFAAIATGRGVWVSQSPSRGSFGPVHLLTSGDARPQAMRAAELDDGGAIVAWTETNRSTGPYAARQIFVATGAATSAPARARALVTVAKGHSIDELGLVGSGRQPALAWIESWYDGNGNYRSQVVVADISHPGQRRRIAVHGTIASGLAFVANGAGKQVLSWRTCTFKGSCTARAEARASGGRFARDSRLGSIDAAAVPTAAVASRGEALVGWIADGHVLAADLRAHARRFAAAETVSATHYAADLTLGFAPTGDAIAVWSQGTLAPDVMGAAYTP